MPATLHPPPATPVWPRPQRIRLTGAGLDCAHGLGVTVSGAEPWLKDAAQKTAQLLNRTAGRPIAKITAQTRGPLLTLTTMERLPSGWGLKPVDRAEGYALAVTPRGAVLAGHDAAGLFYGAQSLAQLLAAGALPDGRSSPRPRVSASGRLVVPGVRIEDWPRFPLRGAHLFVPPRQQLGFMLEFLDLLASFKCNTVILEIGAGMKLERHPEINAAWRAFCREALAYDYYQDRKIQASRRPNPWEFKGPEALQISRYFAKDSLHTELGGGDCLTRDELRRIVTACADRHIELIPEIQSFSHCYWLALAHPEIAERKDDPWPDTYCPSNPKSYALLFDVLDEVLEVIQPRRVHIGHDEAYTLGVCPKCRKRSGHDLFASDIRKIHAYLAERGLGCVMWGDKLMNIRRNGQRYGGVAAKHRITMSGQVSVQPATYRAADRVPKDILIMDWYWGLDPRSERNFHKHGFNVVYGNFQPLAFKDWARRSAPPFVRGAEISSWCEVSPEAFGHNGILYHFFPGSDMLWHGAQLPAAAVCARMARTMTPLVDRLTGQARWLVNGPRGRVSGVDLSKVCRPRPAALEGKMKTGHQVSTVLGRGTFELLTDSAGNLERCLVLDDALPVSPRVPVGRKARRLLLLHGTTMTGIRFQPSFYSLLSGPAVLVRYCVQYADGRKITFPAHYGEEIGYLHGPWPAKPGGALYQGLPCYRAVPVPIGNQYTLYAQEWVNPRPGVPITGITAALGPEAGRGEVLIAAISVLS